MKIHPRHIPVEEARRELAAFLSSWADKHDLTPPEEVYLLAEAIESSARLSIRAERKEGWPMSLPPWPPGILTLEKPQPGDAVQHADGTWSVTHRFTVQPPDEPVIVEVAPCSPNLSP